MPKIGKKADSIIHPPSGSSYPGKEEANPYIFYPPKVLRRLIKEEQSADELKKMKSALKQWERIYVYPGYPYRIAAKIRHLAYTLLGAQPYPSINIPYYQESDIPAGVENTLHMLENVNDNYDMQIFDYSRQGERPCRDSIEGDFLTPPDPVYSESFVKPQGEGPDPEIEYPFPPTGGDIEPVFDMI